MLSDTMIYWMYTAYRQKEKTKKLLYHNSDSTNANSLFPMWSTDKSRINFVAMQSGEWRKFSMKTDGSDVKVES
jgi:hypothetical protein